MILISYIIVSYDQNISLIILCEWWIPCQALTSVLCLHYRPETVHCSTKDVYTSEITFLALHPCFLFDLIMPWYLEASHEMLKTKFNQFGSVAYVSIPKFKNSSKAKGQRWFNENNYLSIIWEKFNKRRFIPIFMIYIFYLSF